MKRVILIPLVLLCALPAHAQEPDKLEARLQALEARIAKLRAEAKREAMARAALDKRLAALDKEIAERKQADPTALGATRIANLQEERARIEAARRTLRIDLAKGEREVAAKAEAIEKSRQPVDVEGLMQRAQRGDAPAVAELTKLRSRIDMAIRSRAAAQRSAQVIGLGGAGGFRVVNRVMVNGRRVAQAAPAAAAKPVPAKKPVSAEEQAKRGEEDRTDQRKRAAELELRIVAMTRKLMELERRVEDLKQKVAKPDAG